MYTGSMRKIIAKPADEPRSVVVRNTAWVYAGVLVVMAVAQLFAFEKFVPLMDDYLFPGGHGTATLVASSIVFIEVFALPFLLRMFVSDGMRWFSLVCSVLVPLIWLRLSLYSTFAQESLKNGGLLGTKVTVSSDVQLLVASLLLVVSLYVVHGLWPVSKK